jgi:Flp pilus assembly protein TadD
MKIRSRNESSRCALHSVKYLTVLGALVVSIVLRVSAQVSGKNYSELLRDGVTESSSGNFSSAMIDLEAAVKLDPDKAEAWYELGVVHGEIGDFGNAEAMFRRSIQLQPDLAKAHYSLGLTLVANPQKKLDWPNAIDEFRAALKYRPDYPDALNYLGAGLIALDKPALAIPELQHALRLAPALGVAHFNLAIALEKTGRLEEALKEYQLAVTVKAGYPEASSALGKLLFQMGRNVDAEMALRQALKLNPDLEDAHYALARVLRVLKSPGDAAVEFTQARDLAQREPDAIKASYLSNQGLALAAKGDFAGAIVDLRQAIRLRPDYGVPHYNLGLLLADSGDLHGALQELAEAISLLPGQAKPWFDLGRVLRRQGDEQGAFQAISRAARLAPDDLKVRTELASMNVVAPALAGHEEDFFMLMPDLGPVRDTAPDHLAFATKLSQQGNFNGAAGQFLRCLSLEPAQIDARRGLANVYEHLGDFSRAALEYNQILLVSPGDADAVSSLAKLQPGIRIPQ